jgi:hypothetical protein
MPTEQLGSKHEQGERSKGPEVDQSAQLEKAREILKSNESGETEKHAENRAEEARKLIDRQEPEPPAATEAEDKPAPSSPIAFLNHHLNYAQTLASVQRKLSPVSRTFSKVIHTPLVEKTSEALESNVARPSVLLGITWTALIVGSIFYITAHHYGYALSGSELLFSFIVGALLGLVLEGIWRVLTRHK